MSSQVTENMSAPPSSSTSSSAWFRSYIKLQFFSRIRRFLQSKSARKRCTESNKPAGTITATSSSSTHESEVQVSEKETEDDSVILQKSVKKLHFGSWEEKEMAAEEIRRIAKEDVKIKKLMAELGVIQMLVSMVATEVVDRRRVAVKALIELANGTYTNKALMVEAGILSKLPTNIDSLDESTRQEFAELLLSLSSLAKTEIPISPSETLPFLVAILESESSHEKTKELCIGTLFSLSAVLDNAGPLVSHGVVHTLLELSSAKELSEKALAALGNLVVTLMGKKAVEDSPLVPGNLIEILTWEDKPKCQEWSAYILMILAHQSSAQREKMAKSGIVHVILEVALLGSPLAQKRALKLLQWFKDERQVRMGPHSGPQTGRIAMGSPVNPREAQEGRKMMKSLVKQSLHKNLEMITRRANAEDPSKLKSLVISTSSKSLPY